MFRESNSYYYYYSCEVVCPTSDGHLHLITLLTSIKKVPALSINTERFLLQEPLHDSSFLVAEV